MSKGTWVIASCGISAIVALVITLLAGCQPRQKQTAVVDSTGGNPFSPPTNTLVRYVLSEPDSVLVILYDVNGKVVDTVVNGFEQTGEKTIPLMSTKLRLPEWPDGVYFYRVTIGDSSYTKKLVVMK